MRYILEDEQKKFTAKLSLKLKEDGDCRVVAEMSDGEEYDLLTFTGEGIVLLHSDIDESSGFVVDEDGCLEINREER